MNLILKSAHHCTLPLLTALVPIILVVSVGCQPGESNLDKSIRESERAVKTLMEQRNRTAADLKQAETLEKQLNDRVIELRKPTLQLEQDIEQMETDIGIGRDGSILWSSDELAYYPLSYRQASAHVQKLDSVVEALSEIVRDWESRLGVGSCCSSIYYPPEQWTRYNTMLSYLSHFERYREAERKNPSWETKEYKGLLEKISSLDATIPSLKTALEGCDSRLSEMEQRLQYLIQCKKLGYQ